MPILTKYLYEIRCIHEMNIGPHEKIELLQRVKIDPKDYPCSTCRGRRAAAERLLQQMINGDIDKLRKVVENNHRDCLSVPLL